MVHLMVHLMVHHLIMCSSGSPRRRHPGAYICPSHGAYICPSHGAPLMVRPSRRTRRGCICTHMPRRGMHTYAPLMVRLSQLGGGTRTQPHSHTVTQSHRHTGTQCQGHICTHAPAGTYAHMPPQAHTHTCTRRHICTHAHICPHVPAGTWAHMHPQALVLPLSAPHAFTLTAPPAGPPLPAAAPTCRRRPARQTSPIIIGRPHLHRRKSPICIRRRPLTLALLVLLLTPPLLLVLLTPRSSKGRFFVLLLLRGR